MALAEELCEAWKARRSMDEPLFQLVLQTQARASGCWRLEDGILQLVGFGWAKDMPDEISQGFQAATGRVSLDQIGLGIVKAAVTKKPAVGRRDPQSSGLDGSASWIVKFAANTSLAVPIFNDKSDSVVGVLAVSTAAFVEEGDLLWHNLIQLSKQLSQASSMLH